MPGGDVFGKQAGFGLPSSFSLVVVEGSLLSWSSRWSGYFLEVCVGGGGSSLVRVRMLRRGGRELLVLAESLVIKF